MILFYKNLALLLLGILLSSNIWAQGTAVKKDKSTLTAKQIEDDFDNAYLGMLAYHPKISTAQDSSKFTAHYKKMRAQIKDIKNYDDLRIAVGELIRIIEDGHTGLLDADMLRKGSVYLPFEIEFVDGKFVVSESDDDDMPVGSVIISIDGIAADSLYRETLRFQGCGDNFSLIDTSKIKNCSFMRYRLNDRGYDAKSSIVRIQKGKYEEDVKVNVRTAMWDAIFGIGSNTNGATGKIVDHENKIGVITVRTFASPGIMQEIRSAVDRVRPAKYIIVDLRNNSGGYIRASSLLLSYLISKDVTSLKNARIKTATKDIIGGFKSSFGARSDVRNALRKSKTAWVDLVDALKEENAEDILGRIDSVTFNIAEKEIVVLVNENTYSAGAIAAMALKAKGRKLIGQHPSNDNCRINALYIEELELANSGLVIMMPLIAAEFNQQDCKPGNMRVDTVVTPTIEAMRNGKDVALDYALSYLASIAAKNRIADSLADSTINSAIKTSTAPVRKGSAKKEKTEVQVQKIKSAGDKEQSADTAAPADSSNGQKAKDTDVQKLGTQQVKPKTESGDVQSDSPAPSKAAPTPPKEVINK